MDETTETVEVEETKAETAEVPAQDERDWKADSRKWEARAKENRKEADELKALLESSRTDSERLEAAEKRAKDAEEFVEQAKAELERMQTISKVADEMHVPTSLIRGDTEEEMREYAQSILDFTARSKPSIPRDQGGSAGKPAVTKESIEEIKDPVARVRARAENISLYK